MENGSHHDVEFELFEHLRNNGRISNRELAELLDISPKQAGVRLRRLLSRDDVRIAATVDAFSAGFDFLLAVGVTVNMAAADVARQLAAIPNVISVVRMSGQYDIECLVAAENHANLSEIVEKHLSRVSGVRSLHPSLVLEVVKYQTGAAARFNMEWQLADLPAHGGFDDIDRGIVEQLWINGRETNENIATALGLSESTVRSRVAQMRRNRQIHITAIRDAVVGKAAVFAFVGVELNEGHRADVVDALVAMPDVTFVANVLGRYDILAQILVDDATVLSGVLGAIDALAGVRNLSCSQALNLVKYDYRWTVLTSRPQESHPSDGAGR